MTIKHPLLLLFTFSLLLTSCKKDEAIVEVDPCLSTSPKEISASFRMVFNDLPFALNSDYVLADGHHVTFETVQFFISNMALMKDTLAVRSDNDIMFITPTNNKAVLGKFEQGNYTGMRLDFGIDSIRNHGDPTQYSAGHPLAFHVPSMHWSWNQGYIFAVMEGRYSTESITASNPGSIFTYHIGLDKNYVSNINLSFASPFTLSACGDMEINLLIDLAHVFIGLNIETDNSTQSSSNFPLSAAVRSNIISGIRTDQ